MHRASTFKCDWTFHWDQSDGRHPIVNPNIFQCDWRHPTVSASAIPIYISGGSGGAEIYISVLFCPQLPCRFCSDHLFPWNSARFLLIYKLKKNSNWISLYFWCSFFVCGLSWSKIVYQDLLRNANDSYLFMMWVVIWVVLLLFALSFIAIRIGSLFLCSTACNGPVRSKAFYWIH